jgi:hypothetical protein
MQDTGITDGNAFSKEVKVDLNMLHTLMLNGVGGEVDSPDVITVDRVLFDNGAWSSWRSCWSQQASATSLTTARYSASALDREMMFCRLED